jgi:two-component system LytT family response regulator
MTSCIIIDDQEICQEALKDMLEEHFPEYSIFDVKGSGEDGIKSIQKYHPQLVFLDVEMPGMTGFDMLSKIGEINFEVIFTTSHDRYSMQAIKSSALDYLIKPVQLADLKNALVKVERRLKTDPRQYDLLLKNFAVLKTKITRIALPTLEGLTFVQVDEIMHCDADDNNTMIHFTGGNRMLITKTLKDVEELLLGDDFCRVHNSHVVNINHIRKYVRGNGGYVVMNNNNTISVSRARKEDFLNKISHL